MNDYGNTLWVTNKGKVIEIPPGSDTHHDYIDRNFAKLFPGEQYSQEAVFDVPMKDGWVHVRNHGSQLTFRGTVQGLKKNRKILRDILDSRIGDNIYVDINYMSPDGSTQVDRKSYSMKNFDEIRFAGELKMNRIASQLRKLARQIMKASKIPAIQEWKYKKGGFGGAPGRAVYSLNTDKGTYKILPILEGGVRLVFGGKDVGEFDNAKEAVKEARRHFKTV